MNKRVIIDITSKDTQGETQYLMAVLVITDILTFIANTVTLNFICFLEDLVNR